MTLGIISEVVEVLKGCCIASFRLYIAVESARTHATKRESWF